MKHFLYYGARYGEMLPLFAETHSLECDWEVHFFEPNPFVVSGLLISDAARCGARVSFHRKAVWVHDGLLPLRLQFHNNQGRGAALSILGSTNRLNEGGRIVIVPVCDFSAFVRTLVSEFIVVSSNRAKLQDWTFRRQLLSFRDEVRSRVPETEAEQMRSRIEGETKDFIEECEVISETTPPTD